MSDTEKKLRATELQPRGPTRLIPLWFHLRQRGRKMTEEEHAVLRESHLAFGKKLWS